MVSVLSCPASSQGTLQAVVTRLLVALFLSVTHLVARTRSRKFDKVLCRSNYFLADPPGVLSWLWLGHQD